MLNLDELEVLLSSGEKLYQFGSELFVEDTDHTTDLTGQLSELSLNALVTSKYLVPCLDCDGVTKYYRWNSLRDRLSSLLVMNLT